MAPSVINVKEDIYEISPPVARWVDVMSLATTTAETYTVPAGVHFIRYAGDVDFWMRADGSAATIPTAAGANTVDGTGSSFHQAKTPFFRRVDSGMGISFITGANALITIECFSRHK